MTLLCCSCIPHRYLMIIFCFVIMLVSVGYRTCFALMATHISAFKSPGNASSKPEDLSIFPNCTTTGTSGSKIVDWSGSTVSFFHTAYFAGQFVMSIPAGALAMRCSPKLLFGLTILSSSVVQLFLPLATDVHVFLIFIMRTVQGMLEAVSIPAMNAVISAWAPTNEKARLINFAYSGVYLSPAVAMFASGATACYLSWDSIMYIYGSIGAACCILWMTVIASSPATHPRISGEEKRLLQQNGVSTSSRANSKQQVPWFKLFTSLPMIAIWVAAFTRNFIFALLTTEVQQYYKDVYNLPASMNGLLSGVPQIFMFVFMLLGACLFDMLVKRDLLSVTNTRKLAQCLGFGIQGACTLAVGFADNHILVFVLMCVGVAFSGFAISGYQTNPLDLAPQLAGPLTGISRTGMLGSVVCTSLVSFLPGKSSSLVDWQHMFIIAGSIHIAGVVFYGVFASGKLQPWASPAESINPPAARNYGATIIDSTTDNESHKNKTIFGGHFRKYEEAARETDGGINSDSAAVVDVDSSSLVIESKSHSAASSYKD